MHLRRTTAQQIFLSSSESIKFTLASDGGARDDLGSFGWEIAIGCEVLWQCKGPAFGVRPGSFRAESHGFLSATLFLQACIQCFSITINQNITLDFCCDSDSPLKRIKGSLNRSWENPSCTASPWTSISKVESQISLHQSASHSSIHTLKAIKMKPPRCAFFHGKLK